MGTAEEQKTLEAKMGDSGRVVVMNAEGLDVSRTLSGSILLRSAPLVLLTCLLLQISPSTV